MKLKKDLKDLVESDYTQLTTTEEGKLTGGFGTIKVEIPDTIDGITINFVKCNANPACQNDRCTINQCPSSFTPSKDPTPDPKLSIEIDINA